MRECTSISKSLAFLSLLVVLGSVAIAVGQASSESIHRGDVRIDRIVNGLFPAAITNGQPLPTMTLAERMKFYRVPGVSIAFFDHGQVAWARGYGFGNVNTKKAVTPGTLFQAASVSKSVTALAALRLVQQGKLNLDEDVNRKLTSWKVPDNEFTKNEKVTLRRLLSHTAGLTAPGFAGYKQGEALPTTMQILNGKNQETAEGFPGTGGPAKNFAISGG